MKLSIGAPLWLAVMVTTVTATSKDPDAFMDPTMTEPCDYSCPEMSKSTSGIYCPRDFNDCGCDKGTERGEEECICLEAFTCPDNSISRIGCPVSMRHCVCQPGFEQEGDECVCVDRDCMPDLPECDYECPPLSRSSGLECPTSFDDCECDLGFGKDGDSCVCDSFCPDNSVQNNECPHNPCRHCDCDDGFAMKPDGCFPKCDYLCPPDSRPKQGLDCAKSFEDCECAPGLKSVDGQTCGCAKDCPAGMFANAGVVCPSNVHSDCTCENGFVMIDGQCIKPDLETPCVEAP